MKQFFKMTLATVCGIAIFLLITGLFLVIILSPPATRLLSLS